MSHAFLYRAVRNGGVLLTSDTIAQTQRLLGLDLGGWGSVASFIGLALTAWVAWRVRQISAAYVSRVRLPDLISDLRTATDELGNILNDVPAFRASIMPSLRRLEAVVKSIKEKVSGSTASSSKQLLKAIKGYIRKYSVTAHEDSLRDIYSGCIGLLQEANDYQRDKQWELR